MDDLGRLFDRVKLGVHTFSIVDGRRLEQSPWFLGLPPRDKELIRSIVVASSYPSSAQTVQTSPSFPLASAVRLAHVPLRILVENKEFDGLLVRVAMQAYAGTKTLRLWDIPPSTGDALSIVHGGGTGDLQKEAIRLIEEAKAQGLPVRLIVMIDSDGGWPGDISEKAKSIQTICADAAADCIVLSCRTAENYIPDVALSSWSAAPARVNARSQVEALLRLSPAQRDHFPMKGKKLTTKGMGAIDAPGAPAEQKALFSEVPPEDRRLLVGFDSSIILLFRDHLPLPSASHLDSRDRRGDLRALVSSVEKAL